MENYLVYRERGCSLRLSSLDFKQEIILVAYSFTFPIIELLGQKLSLCFNGVYGYISMVAMAKVSRNDFRARAAQSFHALCSQYNCCCIG